MKLSEFMEVYFEDKDIRITLNTYRHLYPNQQRRIADLLDDEQEKSPNSGNCQDLR